MKTILMISMLFAGSAFANYRLDDAPAVIGEQIEEQVSNTLEGLKNVDLKPTTLEESWVASRIRLLIAPYVAFDAELLEIKVKPILEFRWERKPPKGWEIYKPATDSENEFGTFTNPSFNGLCRRVWGSLDLFRPKSGAKNCNSGFSLRSSTLSSWLCS